VRSEVRRSEVRHCEGTIVGAGDSAGTQVTRQCVFTRMNIDDLKYVCLCAAFCADLQARAQFLVQFSRVLVVGMAESADATDLKSVELNRSWGFNSPSRHQ
jgi:hypothetical protein